MSFSYSEGNNPMIDYPRILISDTQNTSETPCLFQDSEIMAMYAVQAATLQSSMYFTAPAGNTLPSQPLSYLRVAALLLDSLASNKAYLASIKALPDVKLDSSDAAKALHEQAQSYRDVEDNSGAFMIIEQVTTGFGFTQRFWNQVARMSGGGGVP